MTKANVRAEPRLDVSELTETFVAQLDSGTVSDAAASGLALPSLESRAGQPLRLDRCLWRSVTLTGPKARGLRMRDARIENSDLANIDLTGGALERVEIVSSRLTGAVFAETQLKSVLFRECKLDLALLRMARLEKCAFENCNLAEADFYASDLCGTLFRGCDLGRADISHAKLTRADLRDCRLDGMRGTPSGMDGLIISPDQAPLLITLFGVRVEG